MVDKINFVKMTVPEAAENATVSLFVVSIKHPGLKKLDLSHLNHEQRSAKLHKWAEQHRFVAVIESGDKVFAQVHAHHMAKLQEMGELSIEGKKVTVQALTDEEYAEFAELCQSLEDEAGLSTLEDQADAPYPAGIPENQRVTARERLNPNARMGVVIAATKKILSDVILNCLQEFSKARREAELERKEDQKRSDIKQQIIRKEILKKEVTKGEIVSQGRKIEIASEE